MQRRGVILGGASIDRAQAALRAIEKNEDAARFLARFEFLSNPKSESDNWSGGKVDAARQLAPERLYGMDSRRKKIWISDFIEELSLGVSSVQGANRPPGK